jgi:sigma-B regulation protein RsbU (phosphoserine phosphatase)
MTTSTQPDKKVDAAVDSPDESRERKRAQAPTLRRTILALVAALNVASTIAACCIAYKFQKNAFLHGIDRFLSAGAIGAQRVYGDEFHQKLFDGANYSTEEELAEVKRISELACWLELKYVAALAQRNGHYYYTISSSPQNEIDDGTYDRFWTKYDDVTPALAASFADGQERFEEHEDKYGSFRSAYVPFSLPGHDKPDYVYIADISLDYIYGHLHQTLLKTAFAGLVICAISLWLTYILANHIATPMTRLAGVIRSIVQRDFQMQPAERTSLVGIADRSHMEVAQVASAFCKLETRLQDYFVRLEQTAAERERIASELNIAHDIQMGLLPRAMPQSAECELFARVIPAKEVGGDLFDVAQFDDGRLMLVVADVSGKGVPAGLFMAMTKTLLDVGLNYGRRPEEIVKFLNNRLSADNDAYMFVTLFLGIFDPHSGLLEYSNAGHNPPYLRRADGTVVSLGGKHGPALGIMPGTTYTCESQTLEPGDVLVMYTDGVTEAQNPAESLFSEGRLESCLHDMVNPTASDTVRLVIDEVVKFQGSAPQFDDITLLALRYVARAPEPLEKSEARMTKEALSTKS